MSEKERGIDILSVGNILYVHLYNIRLTVKIIEVLPAKTKILHSLSQEQAEDS